MKAAERGHAASQTLVGECYLDGLGVERNVERGEVWLYRAARQNNKRAEMLLRSR
jgi:TPR repeat protein